MPPRNGSTQGSGGDAFHPYPPARSETEEPSGQPVSVEPLTNRRPDREPSGPEFAPTRTRPPPRATGERCAFCGQPRDPAVDTCSRCGWNWRLAERRCAKCGGPVVLTSRRRSRNSAARVLAAVLVSLGAAASGYLVVRSTSSYAVGSLIGGASASVAFVLLALLVGAGWRCARCGTKPASVYVEHDQRRRLLRRRALLAAGIVALAVATWLFAAPP